MYWHEDNIVYYVKDFDDVSTWDYICTCKDVKTAEFIRNLLSFSENGFDDLKEVVNQMDEELNKLNSKSKKQLDNFMTLYMFIRREAIP